MCVMSMVIATGQKMWPNTPYQFPTQIPSTVEWQRYLELIATAKEFDTATKQPDCEDLEKVKWLDAMNERMSALEDKLDKILDKVNPSRNNHKQKTYD